MRLLLVGAFAYPHTLGSQVYFQEQAIALRAAGADVHLLTYGPPPRAESERAADREPGRDPDRWRALDGFDHTALPAWAVPASRRSGPNLGKPIADLYLTLALRRITSASFPAAKLFKSASSAETSAPPIRFDAILAHHAEAALAALHGLRRSRPPIVYCAHTLLEQELPEYAKSSKYRSFPDSGRLSENADEGSMTQLPTHTALATTGRVIDRWIARRTDAWIALTQASERVMSGSSSRLGRRIAPPLPDPQSDPERRIAGDVACAHGLVPDRFFLYAGNLDPYQDLPLLERVAQARARQADRRDGSKGPSFPIVVATHDDGTAGSRGAPVEQGVRAIRVRTAGEANALVAAARATIVPRRSLGGFPIKLANSLAAGTPVVAFHAEEWGLVDGRDSLIGDLARPEGSLVEALEKLADDADLAARLGAGARASWSARHQPARVAADTLGLIEKLV